MYVIGVAAQLQNGKDTLSDYLAYKLNEIYPKFYCDKEINPPEVVAKNELKAKINSPYWQRASFASNVKKVFCDTFDKDLDFVEKWKTNPEPPPGFSKNIRQSLQFIGDGFYSHLNSLLNLHRICACCHIAKTF